MSKHTPGPWFFDQHGHVYGTSEAQPIDGFPGGKTILHPHVCTPRCISDARLIAAAPELLEALEKCRKELSAWMRCYCEDAATQEAISQASAAIAKATGEKA